MTCETFDQSDEKTWPDQQKDNKKDNEMTKKTIKKTKTMTIEENPQKTIPETFNLWDSDYISVNWEQQSQQSQRDKSARMLWFLRQKCAYVMIFATRMLWVLRQKCVHTLWFLQQKCAYVVSSTTTIVFLVFLVQTPVFPKFLVPKKLFWDSPLSFFTFHNYMGTSWT